MPRLLIASLALLLCSCGALSTPAAGQMYAADGTPITATATPTPEPTGTPLPSMGESIAASRATQDRIAVERWGLDALATQVDIDIRRDRATQEGQILSDGATQQ